MCYQGRVPRIPQPPLCEHEALSNYIPPRRSLRHKSKGAHVEFPCFFVYPTGQDWTFSSYIPHLPASRHTPPPYNAKYAQRVGIYSFSIFIVVGRGL